MWDATHAESRGYGELQRPAGPASDGTPKWFVRWDSWGEGQRITAIKQHSLQLSLIHHRQRVAPATLGQRIQVVAGPQQGKSGTAVKKVSGLRLASTACAVPLASCPWVGMHHTHLFDATAPAAERRTLELQL